MRMNRSKERGRKMNRNEQIWNVLKDKITAESIKINLDLDKKPSITDSKFGGVPYWDKNTEYPVNGKGEKLYLLAQINFEKDKLGKPFPNKGMLQFFIEYDPDFVYEYYKVIYHENIDYSVTKEEVEQLGIPDGSKEIRIEKDYYDYPTAILGEFSLKFGKDTTYMFIWDDRFQEVAEDVIQGLFDQKVSEEELDDLMDDFSDYLYDQIEFGGSRMLGYHYFTQCDPRPEEDEYALLLQIDSEYLTYEKECIMWGDAGVCNFFIKKEDLERLCFDDVVFSWDCT